MEVFSNDYLFVSCVLKRIETIDRLNKRGAETLLGLSRDGRTGFVTMSKGKFKPKNPQKYRGNVSNIVWRSSWELSVMMALDQNPNVVWWNSEDAIVPYTSPKDNRLHRYHPDFLVAKKEKDGSITITMIEIKPFSQTRPPKKRPRQSETKYLNEVITYGVNQAKWAAARRVCENKGWAFQVLTEKDLGLF